MIRILSILLLLIFSAPANAQNFVPLESLGTNNILGNSLYKNANRKALISLFKNIHSTDWISLNKALETILLAQSDANLIQNDVQINPGEDILTLRLNALLNMGMNAQALELYNKTENLNINEPLARLGTLSMLLNKQTAQACLEVKTFEARYKKSSFWRDLNAYCTILLSEEEQPDAVETILNSTNTVLQSIIQSKGYVFEYEKNTYSKLNFLERSILVAEDRISLSIDDISAYEDIPQNHLGALLNQTKTSPAVKLLIALKSAKHSIIDEKQLKEKYEELLKTITKTETETNILKIIQLYSELQKSNWNILKSTDTEKVNQLFDLAQNYGAVILLPFLPSIESIDLKDGVSLKHINVLFTAYLYSERDLPKKWLTQLQEIQLKSPKEQTKLNNLIAAYLCLTKTEKLNIYGALNSEKSTNTINVLSSSNIIENIDKDTNIVDNIMYIYENDFDLRNNKRYTLPPYEILMSLEQSSRNQNISMTLLLTALTLGVDASEATYRGTLIDSANALHRTGLNRVANGILAQAILEIE